MRLIRVLRRSLLWMSLSITVLVVLPLTATTAVSSSSPSAPAPAQSEPQPTDQIIIKYKSSARISRTDAMQEPRLEALSRVAGVSLTYFREMSGDAHVLKLPAPMPVVEINAIAARLMTLPEVEYAEPDSIMQPDLVPNDPLFTYQWGYSDTFGINAPAAWDITTGSSSLVVAVIDTGILPTHPDIAGRILPGYDFISNVWRANDGDGRDADPSDPGDWVAAGDCGSGKPAKDSSWHGTHVAGTIGAATNNGVGVSGVNWNSLILPVRVLGRCGNYTSDIADGIRWAAGMSVSGVPANANPARILNLSLTGIGACGSTYQNAIDDARNHNAVVIVSAGNDNADASNYHPANCNGVVVVAATDSFGDRSIWNLAQNSASNFGNIVTISAPGTGIFSTLNSGKTTPGADSYAFYDGTSMAAPHVSGVASLALTMRPNLTPDQLAQLLKDSITGFPSGSTCTTSLCGAGIVNAMLAVRDIYVDKNYADVELGTPHQPFNTVSEANADAWDRAWIRINAGSYNETVTFSRRLTIVSNGGTVTIGR